MKIKNISDEVQTFTNHKPFEPNEVRDVDDAEAELLLRSHAMQKADTHKVKGVSKDKSFKAVDED